MPSDRRGDRRGSTLLRDMREKSESNLYIEDALKLAGLN